MAVYKFRVTFEDYDDVSRDIEIKAAQTFEDLHYAIHSYIGFDASKPASFFMSDDFWKKGREISNRELKGEEKESVVVMRNARLCDFIIDPHQKIYYLFDPQDKWSFRIELIKIFTSDDNSIPYPKCVRTVGEAPKQYPPAPGGVLPVPEDFDETEAAEVDSDEDEVETDTVTGVDDDDIPAGVEEIKDESENDVDEELDEIVDDDSKDDDEV